MIELYNQQLPQSALGSKTPLQAMKDWDKLKPKLFKKQRYYLTGCDSYGEEFPDNVDDPRAPENRRVEFQALS